MIDKRGREYLKMSKPAFIADVDREEGGRTAKRLQVRAALKKTNWRQLRKMIGARARVSFNKRLAITEYVMRPR
jgi:hypothetical protein